MTSIPADVIHAAIEAMSEWGVPASVTIAQWAVESNWGRATPAGSNNCFGIKAVIGQPSVTAHTREVVHGQSIYIDAQFRKFASIADAFEEHGRLLATAHPYARIMASWAVDHNADHFADALTGVYATAPNYGAVLKSVMRANNLYQYDVVPTSNISSQGEKVAAAQTRPQVPAPPTPAVNQLNTSAWPWPPLAVGDTLGLELALTHLGYGCSVTGADSPVVMGSGSAAIRAFQSDHGLDKIDGIAGPLTVAAINEALAKKAAP